MIIPERTDQCIPTGHDLKAWCDTEARPPRPIGLTCTRCQSWWPIAVSHYVVFNHGGSPRDDVGHTIDGRHLDRTRCGKRLTPGTWTAKRWPNLGCTACMPRPVQPAGAVTLDDVAAATESDEQIGLWQDVQ
ncbi:hypothetical protein [Sphaerimonospora mesophila]|uniref:hypothetical protein n=1 Tax=Sphaerimonospora mesophila TaxID=37483 RepID=UPI0006E28BAA